MVKPNIQWIDQEFGGTGHSKYLSERMWQSKLKYWTVWHAIWKHLKSFHCLPSIAKYCLIMFKSTQGHSDSQIYQYYHRWFGVFNRFGVVTQVMFSMCIFVSYGLQFYVPMEIIGNSLEKTYPARKLGPKLFDYLLRSFFVLITC